MKSVETEIVDIMKKLSESENKRFDAETKLEEAIKQIHDIRAKRPSVFGDPNYENSAVLNKIQKQLVDKIEEVDKLKIQTDKDLKKYLNEIDNLQVKFR